MTLLERPSHVCTAGILNAPGAPLRRMCAEIEMAAANPVETRHDAVAHALLPFLVMPDLLREASCACSPDHYTRHLLHAGKDHTVLALVWRPGQMSPVHGHRSWCALGIHRGTMTETMFELKDHRPVAGRCTPRGVGSISGLPADPCAIHRLANLGSETAFSIHVYGARYDRLGEEVNHIWAG